MKKKTDWEDLDFSKGIVGGKDTTISFNKDGAIRLNIALYRELENEIKKNPYIRLGFSKSKNAIVLSISNTQENSFKISSYKICAKPFLNKHGITLRGTFKATLEKVDGHGKVWVVYLNESK